MPIQEGNIVFVKSQQMDDVPEGGGAATGTVIIDGAMNNVFEDISDLDRAYGRFNLRKLFLAVRALNTDLYGGAKTIISLLPTDPALGYTLFTTDSPFDTRAEAADRVESYLYKGPLWHGALNENHLTGMRVISVIQRVGTVLPPVGKTLCLAQNEGLSNEAEQYIRVIKVSYVETVFTDDKGDYTRWIVKLELSDALRFDFAGHTVNRFDEYNYTGKTRLRDTSVADAAQYYSTRRLTTAAAIGDRTVNAGSAYTQLVPSTATEAPVTDVQAGGGVTVAVSGGARSTDFPAVAHTLKTAITPETRALNYTQLLLPKPAANTVVISYRALGNWYTVRDDGAGKLTGAGSGTINYSTGSVALTVNAIPDAGSGILWAWGTPVHFDTPDLATATIEFPGWSYQLLNPHIEKGSVTITWLSGGATKTAIDNNGVISGDAVGRINYAAGLLYLKPIALPDAATTPQVTYRYGAPVTETFTPTLDGNRFVTVTIADPPIKPGSVSAQWTTRRKKTESEKIVEMGV